MKITLAGSNSRDGIASTTKTLKLKSFSLRKFGCSTSCWLDAKYIWIYLSTVALVIAWNVAVTVRAISASYQSAKLRLIRCVLN